MSQPGPPAPEPPPKTYFAIGQWDQDRPALAWPRYGNALGFRAALLSQLIARNIRRKNDADYEPGALVKITGLPRTSLDEALDGNLPFSGKQIATLAAFPDVLPTENHYRSVLRRAWTAGRAARIPALARPAVFGLLDTDITSEDLEAEALLAGLAGGIHVPSQQEQQQQALLEHASALPLLTSARLLAERAGLPAFQTEPLNAHRTSPDIRPATPGHNSAAWGTWTASEPLLSAALHPDWLRTVHSPGWTIIDGHFISHISEVDGQGRPLRADALRLQARDGSLEHADFDADTHQVWTYTTAPALIRWQGERATVVSQSS